MAEKYILNFEANTSKAVKSVDKLDDSIKDTSKNTQELESSMSGLDQASGGMITKFKGLKQGLKNVITGFKSMRVAIIATGIGALVLAVSALGAAFTNTEEGQNKFNKIMLVISSVTGNLIDILASLGNGIIDAFTNPMESIEKFKDFIVENITNRFEAAIDTIGFLGSAIKKVFSGDFAGAMDDAKSAGSSYIDTLTGVEDTIGKTTKAVKELGEEITKEGKIAADIADQRAKADKLERQLIVDRAEANRQRAKLLEQAVDRENFTVEQRIGFLEEAGKLEEDITNKEIEAAKIRLQAKQAENALAGSNKADLEEEARLKAELINLETARLTKQKEVTSQTIALKAEEAAELKAIEDQKIADKAEQDAEDAEAKKIQDEADAADEKNKKDRNDRIAANEIATQEKIKNAKRQAVESAIALFGAETNAGKAALIAKQVLAAQEMIQEARKTITFSSLVAARSSAAVAEGTAQTAKIGFPQNIPMLVAYALQAVGIMKAITGAVGKSKSTASSLGAGGGASVSTSAATTASSVSTISASASTPSFDILGTSGTNQLAAALGGQPPVQAFVVSQDVTTAQSLQNNIIQGASLG